MGKDKGFTPFFAVVAIGTLAEGFGFYGPITMPETYEDIEIIKKALADGGEAVDSVSIIPGKLEQSGTETGQYVFIEGGIKTGFAARGLYKSADAARKSMSGFHHMYYQLTPLDCSLTIK